MLRVLQTGARTATIPHHHASCAARRSKSRRACLGAWHAQSLSPWGWMPCCWRLWGAVCPRLVVECGVLHTRALAVLPLVG